jgi:hypothetical protein
LHGQTQLAIGGQAGAGGKNGGHACGGGIGTSGGPQLKITGSSIIDSNQAQGGKPDTSGPSNGGDGLGGGLCNVSGSTMNLSACLISNNGVSGGKGTTPGKDGQEEGRSIYSQGTLIVDPTAVIN